MALATSVFHLGRPQYAFRAVIGLRHSWLSREIVAFGIFAAAGVRVRHRQPDRAVRRGRVASLWGSRSLVSGIVGVLCSVFVYAVTRRALWNAGSDHRAVSC